MKSKNRPRRKRDLSPAVQAVEDALRDSVQVPVEEERLDVVKEMREFKKKVKKRKNSGLRIGSGHSVYRKKSERKK